MDTLAKEAQHTYCSRLSLQAGETLFGTAAQTSVYLLLEYDRVWGAKALEESKLPDTVKERLQAYTKSRPDLKVLLIKRKRADGEEGARFFVACTEENRPKLYSFHLRGYDELLSLDIEAVLSGEALYERYQQHKPLMLVCTNGRRDACCAKFALPIYHALAKIAQDSQAFEAWQCTHLGGHRFAPNVLCLPQGLLYGRVSVENSKSILENFLNGQALLPNLRGRACFSPVVQAAEYHLRTQSGETALEAFSLRQAQETAPQHWRVQLDSNYSGAILQVEIIIEKSALQIYESCSLDKTTPAMNYLLADYQVLKPEGSEQ